MRASVIDTSLFGYAAHHENCFLDASGIDQPVRFVCVPLDLAFKRESALCCTASGVAIIRDSSKHRFAREDLAVMSDQLSKAAEVCLGCGGRAGIGPMLPLSRWPRPGGHSPDSPLFQSRAPTRANRARHEVHPPRLVCRDTAIRAPMPRSSTSSRSSV